MSNVVDPSQRALLYSEMVVEAKRLGDTYLLSLAQSRLGEAHKTFRHHNSEDNIIPFPLFDVKGTLQVKKSQSLLSILLQSAMIPAGMAIILYAFVQASLHIYSGPVYWLINK